MADSEHLAILRQGVEAWNVWRMEHPDVTPDLSGANHSKMDLTGANLSGTDLRGADLSEANLSKSDLRGANLTQGGERWNLHGVNLSGANLSWANLTEADLSGAYLNEADLTMANLAKAVLSQANLTKVMLRGTNLSETQFAKSALVWTVFVDVDLSVALGLESASHQGPSTIGIDTLYKSGGKIAEIFLRRCGVPKSMIEYVRSLVESEIPIRYYTCFLSHSSKDMLFCDRLYADLQARGVRVWYFPEDATWGRTVWGEIDRAIKVYDKLVVICSERSLQSGPVLREVERALRQEDRTGAEVLFPVRLDDYVFKPWEHERKDDVLSKVIGDFIGWDTSATKYDASFKRLLAGLQGTDAGDA